MDRMIGKRLLKEEITLPTADLDGLVKAGEVTQIPALTAYRGKLSCRRCGTNDQTLFGSHHCAKCQKECAYCRHCILLGKMSECASLYYVSEQKQRMPKIEHSLVWKGELSEGQIKAVQAVNEAIKHREQLLVWAVAGAGKTELLFPGLEKAFAKGMRVLLATPRVDVVKELTPRLKQNFPTIRIASLYGGSRNNEKNPQLVIATTHQVMRYYKAFDVVIIDEVDAFPYTYDESLQYAVTNAKKDASSTIYLTATPNKSLLTQDLQQIKIPRRHHGYPLPEPQFSWCHNWKKQLKKKEIPRKLTQWLTSQLQYKKPILIFVPTLSVLQNLSDALDEISIRHAAVHADEPLRHQMIDAFRKGRLQLLITTTILERGVTFSDVQVAVLGAEHDVFTESALVQIAGRVGRDERYPNGDIIFFHYGISTAMKAAKRQIKMMNEEGARK